MPEVDFCWPAVSAQDRPVEVRGLHELYLALANTGKHVQTVTVVEPELARGGRRDGARRARAATSSCAPRRPSARCSAP